MMRSIFAVLMCAACGLVSAAPQLPITVLYKKDTGTSADRLDPAVQSALQSFDENLLEAGFQVVQPEPKIYAMLDRAQGVIVTFSADAGYSVLLDVVKSKRPYAGTDLTYAEVRIRTRVYHGRNVLASAAELGSVAYKNAAAEDKAFEAAARRAVGKAAAAIVDRLGAAPPPQPAPAPSLIVDAATPAPDEAQTVATGKKWALMVGVSDFSAVRKTGIGANDLPGVAIDMKAMRDTLLNLGVEPSRMIWLFNEQATTKNVRDALQKLKDSTAPDDLVYLYFSTHGTSKEDGLSRFGIPLTYDFSRSNFIDFEQLRAGIGALQGNNVIWINDTCHSGLATEGLVTVEIGSRNIGIVPAASFDASAAADLKNKNIAVLSSATASQSAADMGSRGGLFSSVFVDGAKSAKAQGALPSAYGFFKQYIDGKVQAGYRELCSRKPRDEALCSQEGGQQPVFAAQNKGKLLRM
jgi:hypothetical protein